MRRYVASTARVARVIRMRSKKRHQRIEIINLRYGYSPRTARRWREAIKG
jgi:hypothetical protein